MAGTHELELCEDRSLPSDSVLSLYEACGWSAARRPRELLAALAGSDAVISAWYGDALVGLGNAISDGALVVYYPHLLVLPGYRRAGVGRRILERLASRYEGFHQQTLLAVAEAVPFYQAAGFRPARGVEALWIYEDAEHDGAGAREGGG